MASAPDVESTEDTGTRALTLPTLASADEILAIDARSRLPTQHSNSYILPCLRSVCRDDVAAVVPRA